MGLCVRLSEGLNFKIPPRPKIYMGLESVHILISIQVLNSYVLGCVIYIERLV